MEHYIFINKDFNYIKFNNYIILFIMLYYINIYIQIYNKCECGNKVEPNEDLCKECLWEQHSDCMIPVFIQTYSEEDINLNKNFDITINYVSSLKDIEIRIESQNKYYLNMNRIHTKIKKRKKKHNKKNKEKLISRNYFINKEYILKNLELGNKVITNNENIIIENKKNKSIKILEKDIKFDIDILSIYIKNDIEEYTYCKICNSNMFSNYNICNNCYVYYKNFKTLLKKIRNLKYIFNYRNRIFLLQLFKLYINKKIDIICINFNTYEHKIIKI